MTEWSHPITPCGHIQYISRGQRQQLRSPTVFHVLCLRELAHLWLAWHAGSYPSGEQEHADAASSGLEYEYLPGDNSPSLIRFSGLCKSTIAQKP